MGAQGENRMRNMPVCWIVTLSSGFTRLKEMRYQIPPHKT